MRHYIPIYFARGEKRHTVENGRDSKEQAFLSHLVVNGRYMYICGRLLDKYDLVPEYTIHFIHV